MPGGGGAARGLGIDRRKVSVGQHVTHDLRRFARIGQVVDDAASRIAPDAERLVEGRQLQVEPLERELRLLQLLLLRYAEQLANELGRCEARPQARTEDVSREMS